MRSPVFCEEQRQLNFLPSKMELFPMDILVMMALIVAPPRVRSPIFREYQRQLNFLPSIMALNVLYFVESRSMRSL